MSDMIAFYIQENKVNQIKRMKENIKAYEQLSKFYKRYMHIHKIYRYMELELQEKIKETYITLDYLQNSLDVE